MAQATLLETGITDAVTAQVSTAVQGFGSPTSATIQTTFTYGSGGTNATVYIQSSIDNGATYFDVAAIRFTTSGGSNVVTVDGKKSVTTPATLTDGALTVNTVQEGFIGSYFRTKLTTTGTYAGGTSIKVQIKTTDG